MCDARGVRTWNVGDITVTSMIEVDGSAPGPFLIGAATPDAVLTEHGWARGTFVDDKGMLLTARPGARRRGRGARPSSSTRASATTSSATWRRGTSCSCRSSTASVRPGSIRSPSTPSCARTSTSITSAGTRRSSTASGARRSPRAVTCSPGPSTGTGRQEPFRQRPEHDDSIQPVVDAGLVDLVDVDAELAPGVSFFSTPGHTPGHCSVLLESGGERALITGDFMHHAVQVAAPGWCSHFDTDAAAGERTRREFIDAYADSDLLVIGTHFGGPGAGRIVSVDGGHELVAVGN